MCSTFRAHLSVFIFPVLNFPCSSFLCSSFTDPTWTALSELKNDKLSKRCFPGAETVLEVMLLTADLFFQHTFDSGTVSVCDIHRNLLLQFFYFIKTQNKCNTCLNVRKTLSCGKADLRNITVSQAITLFEIFKLKNSYGKLICRDCRPEVSKKMEASRERLHNDAFECLLDPESVCCKKDSMDDKDLDCQPPYDPSIDEEKLNKQIIALNNFLAACGSKRKVHVTTSYNDLSHRVKSRYIGLTRFILISVSSLLTSNDADVLIQDTFNSMNSEESNVVLDGNFRQIMNGVSETYSNAESWQSSREILSVVAPKISLKLMQLFIPGLTGYRFSAARFHAAKYGMGSRVETTTVVQRFDDHQIAHFVDFIASPHVCTDMLLAKKY